MVQCEHPIITPGGSCPPSPSIPVLGVLSPPNCPPPLSESLLGGLSLQVCLAGVCGVVSGRVLFQAQQPEDRKPAPVLTVPVPSRGSGLWAQNLRLEGALRVTVSLKYSESVFSKLDSWCGLGARAGR